jgi:predicted permease
MRTELRGLIRAPGFAAVAAGSLALGIAAATGMFSVVHAVILDPFPYRDVDRLASIFTFDPEGRGGRSYYTVGQYLEFREQSRIFEGVIASTISDVVWTGAGEPRRLRGNHGPFDTFEVMGVGALIGRTPTAADERADAPPVAVLGYRFWQGEFGGDPGVLGRQMTLNGVTRTVIGVMPRRFMWRGADVYLPTRFRRGEAVEGVRSVHVLGRVKAGVTAAQAEADLRPIVEEMQRREPQAFPAKWRVRLLPFKETFPSGMQEALWVLFGATGLLLLIACANVSNLLLARGTARRREFAVRTALGAGRWRMARQLLKESLALGGVGGAAGVGLAFALLRAMIAIVPPDTIPDEAHIRMNFPVLAFSVAVSMATALLVGLAPAFEGSRTNLADALKSGARMLGGGRGLLRNALVVAEVALSLVLLSGAGLMLRTLIRLQAIDLEFRPDRVLTLRVPLPAARYPDAARRVAFMREARERISQVPGVSAAAVGTGMHPFGSWRMRVELPGTAPDSRPVGFHQTDPEYLRVYGFRLAAGRAISEQETAVGRRVALVNEAFVRRYFRDRTALGATIRFPQLARAPWELADTGFEIVGVVRDAANGDPTEGVQPETFVPYTVLGAADFLSVLTALEPAGVVKAAAAQVYAIDPQQPVTNVRTVEEMLNLWVFSRARFSVILFGVFAALGLALAVVGVYGVISQTVARRTQEIGLRVALGALARDVAWLVLRRGMMLVGIGLALGLAATWAAQRALASEVEQLAELDPWTVAAAGAVMAIAGAAACLRPARQAMRVDPAEALRNE